MTVKRKKKNGRVYLEEYKSIRINGEVKSIYIRSLGPEKPVIKTKTPKPKVLDRLQHGPSHKAGDVTLLWELACQLDYVDTIDGICCGEKGIEGISPGKILTAWAINRVIDPISATKLEKWVPTTDLPRLMGISPADFTKNAFLTALDFVCYEEKKARQIIDFSPQIDDALYRKWRQRHPLQPGEKETLAYDLTSVLFFGVTCPLAELGANPKKIKRLQMNLALVVSSREKFPLTHFVYNGNRNSVSTIKNLITRLQESSTEKGTIIWDRGSVSNKYVNTIEQAGWKLICGVPKSVNDALEILKKTNIDYSWDTLVRSSKSGRIYATKVRGVLYGKERSVVVYANRQRRVRDGDSRNDALASIEEALQALAENCSKMKENEIRKEAKKIIGDFKDFIDFRIKRKGNGPRLIWKFKKKEIRKAEKLDGLWLLLSTDPSLSAKEVVNLYVEKDFIEKVFRTLKTHEEVEPVRHRLETRVRGYLFLCVLAYRLIADLQHHLREVSDHDDTWERTDTLLHRLGRVERVQIRLGHQVKTWYLNVTGKVQKTLDKMGFQNMFKEKLEVDFKM